MVDKNMPLSPIARAVLVSLSLAFLGALFGFGFVSRHLLDQPATHGGLAEAVVLLVLTVACLSAPSGPRRLPLSSTLGSRPAPRRVHTRATVPTHCRVL